MPKKIALLIGVSEYGEDINPLSAPPNDVKAMKRVLENPEMGGFDSVNFLINPEYLQMTEEIQKLFQSSNKDDLILLFFSGHGIKDDDGQLYLATRITTKNNFLATAASASFIQKMSKHGNYAKRQIIILDCCYSGAFAIGWQPKGIDIDLLDKELGAEGRVILASSSKNQTSFQHEGSELSVYTKHLVEGIETGAADTDGDGKIHIQELHKYAKAKVKEVKPKMEPKIILDNEGYNILISMAPTPEKRFCQEVEMRIKDGEISKLNRDILKTKQENLQLSDEQAEEIISSVIKHHQLYHESLKRYEEEYRQKISKNYPLDDKVIKELEEWASVHLCLRDADVEKIQQRIITELNETINQDMKPVIELTSHPQNQIEVISSSPQQNITAAELILDSERDIDYIPLRNLLAAGYWKDADEKTYHLLLESANREKDGYLNGDDWLKFPCKDLRTIDQLWVKYSDGRFGYSVQKQIWESKTVGGNPNAGIEEEIEIERKFGDTVGWRKGGKWLDYNNLTFNTDAPIGHFPCVGIILPEQWIGGTGDVGREGFGGLKPSFLAQRLANCKMQLELILESEIEIDYSLLRDLLAVGKWKEADEETYRVVLKAANCENGQYLNDDDWLKFPYKDLRTIDQLWIKYSDGHFGFSVQKQIWESKDVGGHPDAGYEIIHKFADKVGWRKGGNWLNDNDLTLNTTAPLGHLPAGVSGLFGNCSPYLRNKLTGWFLIFRKDL